MTCVYGMDWKCSGTITPQRLSILQDACKKRKDSAGSDYTASMFKGGGYVGARTRQINVGRGGCVP